ncbi:MAG: Eco57I restriction-modification methylase domain-containing protein [Candidatus Promineofilum sp.]|nr:Eco57I restriction-modification methylase domain-containing protein [Promineifilum sp.]
MLFVEKCLELSQGMPSSQMIIPNTWTLLFNAQKFRRYLFENYTIEQIVHFNHRVFPKVTVDCEILVACNAPPQGNEVEITLQNLDDSIRYSVLQEDWIKKNGDIISIRQTSEASKIVNKLEILSVRMEDICEIKNGIKPFEVGKGTPPQTKAIASSKPFVSDTKDDNSFVPLLRGSLINRYRTLWNRNYWVSYGPWLAAPRDPHILHCS